MNNADNNYDTTTTTTTTTNNNNTYTYQTGTEGGATKGGVKFIALW